MNLKPLKDAILYMTTGGYYIQNTISKCKTLVDIAHACEILDFTEKEFIHLVNKTINLEELSKSVDPFDKRIYIKIVEKLF